MSIKNVRDLEAIFDYLQGAISGYRKGLNENFIPHGMNLANERLEAARSDLQNWGLYETCKEAFDKVEELVKLGPEHDADAEEILLKVARIVTTRARR